LHKLKKLPSTPISTLEKARALAFSSGLEYAYVGKVPGHEGWNTFCPHMQENDNPTDWIHDREDTCKGREV